MPAYNVEGYIRESIRSVMTQTYPNWELIVIDDGSQDNTAEVAREMARNDTRIMVVSQENGGVSRARNRGLDLAKGELVSFLDADDLWEKEFLTKLVTAMQQPGVGLAYSGYDHLHWGILRRSYRHGYADGWILPDVLKGRVHPLICAMLMDKRVLEVNSIRFSEGCVVGEDQELILKVLCVARARAVRTPEFIYRVRRGSTIRSVWKWENHIHDLYAHQRAFRFIAENYSGGHGVECILSLAEERMQVKVLRFFWRMVKNQYCTDALRLINGSEWGGYLRQIALEKLSTIERSKYEIIMSLDPKKWSLLKYMP